MVTTLPVLNVTFTEALSKLDVYKNVVVTTLPVLNATPTDALSKLDVYKNVLTTTEPELNATLVCIDSVYGGAVTRIPEENPIDTLAEFNLTNSSILPAKKATDQQSLQYASP